jgi:hypothetical protein
MQAAKYDILVQQGATYLQPFLWESDGVAVNLTGYTARMQVREFLDDAAKVFEATSANGMITMVPDRGEIVITIPAATTAGFRWVLGRYDLEVQSPTGIVYRLLQGTCSVSREVTR